MPLPSSINDLSTTAGSNSPAGSESPSTIDDYLRVYASYIAQLRDRTGRFINVQAFAVPSTFTYTPTAGTTSVVVEVQGAGGGSGGMPATTTGGAGFAPAGGSGAYGKSLFTTGFSGVTITIGAAGTAGSAGANAGGTGGGSSFGALLSSPGGAAGPAGVATTTFPINSGAAAGTAAPSGANIESDPGCPGMQMLLAGAPYAIGGNVPTLSKFGTGPGAGAAGSYIGSNTAATAGKAGKNGAVIIWEYA